MGRRPTAGVFPDALPGVDARHARPRLGDARPPLTTTLLAGTAATLLALVLVVGCLEHEVRARTAATRRALAVVYLPLLVPQIGFLFGVQVILLLGRLDGTWTALVGMHLLFVLPYVFLSLREPYLALDPATSSRAAASGAPGPSCSRASSCRCCCARSWRCRGGLRGQRRPVPADPVRRRRPAHHPDDRGGGLASGADRRIGAVYAFVQALLPMAGFTLALLVPRFLYRDRRGMAVA
jgi:putative thiamine transport system permease protein